MKTYYLLFYRTVEGFVEKRAIYREEHIAMVKELHASGALIMGGAMDEPADEAMLIFKGPDDRVAKNFAENDPYVRNGLITDWTIRKWQVAIGG